MKLIAINQRLKDYLVNDDIAYHVTGEVIKGEAINLIWRLVGMDDWYSTAEYRIYERVSLEVIGRDKDISAHEELDELVFKIKNYFDETNYSDCVVEVKDLGTMGYKDDFLPFRTLTLGIKYFRKNQFSKEKIENINYNNELVIKEKK